MIEADIIIVGSGPAGINAAWPLVSAGLSVVMVDASHAPIPNSPQTQSISEWRNRPERWRDMLDDDLSGLSVEDDYSPKFATPVARAVLATGIKTGPEIQNSNMVVSRAATSGGLSSIWGGFSTAFDDEDLKDFPINAQDLAAGYQAVADRIGIAGVQDDLADFHGSSFSLLPPTMLTALARVAHERYDHSPKHEKFKLGYARNAVLTEDKNGRKPCIQCGLCLYGCSQKSIYNSGDELPELQRFSNFRHIPKATVRKLNFLTGDQKILDMDVDGQSTIAKARIVLMAAGTLNTTALVLDHFGFFGQRLRLLSNPVGAMAFIVPQLIGKAFPEKTFSLGQLSYRLGLEQNDYATGVLYGADALPLDLFARRMPLSRHLSLRLSAALAPALLMSTCYISSDDSENFLTLEKQKDRNVIKLEGHIPVPTRKKLIAAGKALARSMRGLGIYRIPGSMTVSPPGSDAHLAGTIAMGGQGALSCDNYCELKGAPGVYIIDGSWLPRLPAKHCTFTISANAHRVGTHIVEKSRGTI